MYDLFVHLKKFSPVLHRQERLFSSNQCHNQDSSPLPTNKKEYYLHLPVIGGFSFSYHREQEEVSPPLFIQQKTLYFTKVFSFQSPIKYVEQAGTCCIVKALQRSVNMLALLSKACCVPTAVLSGSLRSNRVLTGTAAPQPTLPGLPGLDRGCRGCWRPPGPSGTSPALPHRAVVLAVTLRVGNNSQPPTFSLYIRLVTFRASTSGTVGLLPRHAQSTPCAAREKNRVLLSHAAQGVYQTYI